MPIAKREDYIRYMLTGTFGASDRSYTYLNGSSFITFDEITLPGDFFFEVTGTFSPDGFHLLGNLNSYQRIGLYKDTRGLFVGSTAKLTLTTTEYATLTNGNVHSCRVGRFNGVIYMKIDGLPVSGTGSTYTETLAYSNFGGLWNNTTSIPLFKGFFYNANLNNQVIASLSDAWTSQLRYKANNGMTLQGYNITSSDVVESGTGLRSYTYGSGANFMLIPPWTAPTNEFFIEYKCVIKGASKVGVLGADTTMLYITNSQAYLYVNGSWVINGEVHGPTLVDGSVATVRIFKTANGNVSMQVNGGTPIVSFSQVTPTLTDINRGRLGDAYSVSPTFDINLNNERFYPLSEAWSNNLIYFDTTTPFGAEKFLDATDKWFDCRGTASITKLPVGAKATQTSGELCGIVYLFDNLVVGEQYLLSITATRTSNAGVWHFRQATDKNLSYNTQSLATYATELSITKTILVKPTHSAMCYGLVDFQSPIGTEMSITALSIKKCTAAQPYNTTTSDIKQVYK